ncbi:YjzD family protein [Sporosarcina sp. ACRSL]|uniref:DUF2929 family protein n=1 Tax=Sporosarcina sp. ACRSL TaxID=2918215 RepID=UPI001EF3DE65|nr:DUF2929 family protein [Sporosarcina sp. ACRSL]MCG7344653.1 YjzD family protein [Sporosarcina sp. ACRSL]
MKYIITFVMSFLLVSMTNYVAGSIAGVSFDLMGGVIASVVLAIVVLGITAILPDEEVADY